MIKSAFAVISIVNALFLQLSKTPKLSSTPTETPTSPKCTELRTFITKIHQNVPNFALL